MSLLIAIKSSVLDMESGVHDTIRATPWYQTMRSKAAVKFFIGRKTDGLEHVVVDSRTSYNLKSDEVVLDVADHREAAVFKTRAIAQYATGKNISHILMMNNNGVVLPNKIQNSLYAVADYSGIFEGGWGQVGPKEVSGHVIERCYSWANSEHGYFLSRRAAFELADSSVKVENYIIGSNDDLWVGQILGPICASGDLFSIQLDEAVARLQCE